MRFLNLFSYIVISIFNVYVLSLLISSIEIVITKPTREGVFLLGLLAILFFDGVIILIQAFQINQLKKNK
jgi:hypothetical protein